MLSVCTFTARRADHHQTDGRHANSLHKGLNASYPLRSDCFVLVCLTVEMGEKTAGAMHDIPSGKGGNRTALRRANLSYLQANLPVR